MSKLLHVFFDTDMRGRHEALALRAKEERDFDTRKMKPGDLICFINTKRDRLMLLAGLDEADSYGVLAYYRSPHGRIDLNAIDFIPGALGATAEITMKNALRKALESKIGVKRESEEESDSD